MLRPAERNVVIWLTGWSLLFLLFHLDIGPEELHRSHILLGRHLLFGEPAPNPAHPMFGYAIIIAALDSWTPLLNATVGWIGFVLAYRWLDLGRSPATFSLYAAIVGYAAIVTSWNDHALWLGLVMAALAVLYKFGHRGAVAGVAFGLLWGLAYNIRPEALLLLPLFVTTSFVLEWLGYSTIRLKCYVAGLATFVVCMIPWAIYTTHTLGHYTPTTTHNWSVAYYSLGLVPDNKYKIVAQDEWLYERAAEIGEPTPWSEHSNAHFHEKFLQIVTTDYGFFAKRMAWGLYTLIKDGIYTPDLRLLAGRDPDEQVRIRYAIRDFFDTAGLSRYLFSAGTRDLPDRPPTKVSAFEVAMIGGYMALAVTFRTIFVFVFGYLALRLVTRSDTLPLTPLLALTASTIALTLLVATVFLPTPRMSTVPVVLAALLAQSMRCERKA